VLGGGGGVFVVIQQGGTADDPTFKTIELSVKQFSRHPDEGTPVPIHPKTHELVIINQGNVLQCEVVVLISGLFSETRSIFFEAPCKLSGLFDDFADADRLLAARENIWRQWQKELQILEETREDAQIYIKKTSYQTDLFPNKEIFTQFMLHIAYDATCQTPVPNGF
jgi:hypothetical protein